MKPNRYVAAMAAYALPDLSVPAGKRPVLLAQNESAIAPSPAAMEAARMALAQARFYSDSEWTDLRAGIAEVHGLDPALILCGAGSMELIQALGLAYLHRGVRALSTAHGYLYFRTVAQLAGATLDLAPETEFTVDVDELLAAVRPETAMVFVANPGNPTGTRIPRDEIVRLREALPDSVMLVIDEAYGEFADAPGEQVFDLVARGDTVVLRTFSKVYGLAGMRVGWGVFPPTIGAEIRKVQNPGSIPITSLAAAAGAMRDQAHMIRVRDETAARRDRFAGAMRQLGLAVPKSHTNFVLIGFGSTEKAASAAAALRNEGVVLRPMGGYGLADCLRATVGSEEDMQIARDMIADWVEREGAS
ncbi:MAG: aminotransferase class I/II-fold pyridoxal phosphate-dependent enzyme [Paracoccaceae bacterium]|nr:aminotransferase class I/II-fold pyridoxal phosphate-dependent enzyme [Paracoccaceae bacterium]